MAKKKKTSKFEYVDPEWMTDKEKQQLINDLAEKFGPMSYRMRVNLEGTIGNMLYYDLSKTQIKDILEDIYGNLDFLEGDDDGEEKD